MRKLLISLRFWRGVGFSFKPLPCRMGVTAQCGLLHAHTAVTWPLWFLLVCFLVCEAKLTGSLHLWFILFAVFK